jgi:hypothetical protein
LIEEFLRRLRFFARPNALAVVFLKKMRLGVMDWAITLRRWNMNSLMLRVEFATANRNPFF